MINRLSVILLRAVSSVKRLPARRCGGAVCLSRPLVFAPALFPTQLSSPKPSLLHLIISAQPSFHMPDVTEVN